MKIRLLFLLYLVVVNSYGQTNIDEHVSILFPGKPNQVDTMIGNQKSSIFILDLDSEIFMGMRLIPDFKYEADDEWDEDELNAMYRGALKGQNNTMKQNGFELMDSAQIPIQNFVAYKMRYGMIATGKFFTEMVNLIIDRVIYTFSYISLSNFNEKRCHNFLHSIVIKNAKEPASHSNRLAYAIGQWIGRAIGGAVLVIIVLVIIKLLNRKKNITKSN